VAFLGVSVKSRGQAGAGRSSPCSLLQSLSPSFMLLPPWLLSLIFPLCSVKRLGSSQGTGQVPTASRATAPLQPKLSLPKESGDKASPCFILILYTLSIFWFFFLQISLSLFFLPTSFFFAVKASQSLAGAASSSAAPRPPRSEQPPCSLVHPSPSSFWPAGATFLS